MNTEKYFNKNGKIYGISEKFVFYVWAGYKVKFDNYDDAINWLNTEENNFMQRKLVSKTEFNRCKYGIRKI